MVKAIVGANWGDEGKGKITDLLAEGSEIVIRFQGGANAGHTIINEYGRFAQSLVSAGEPGLPPRQACALKHFMLRNTKLFR